MKLANYIPNTPEEAIAFDELLLKKAESGETGQTLWFWEAREHFVVVGRSGKVAEDCFISNCEKDDMKILRRISGGGTVLQGPGCFNYSLVLSYEKERGYKDINESYELILEKTADGLGKKGFSIEFYPISDLALNGKKISGNAQARKKKYFLHHGTFLYDFDIEKIGKYLNYPSREPGYRQGRRHIDFVTNLSIDRKRLKENLKDIYEPSGETWEPDPNDLKELEELIIQKYSKDSWNRCF